MSFPYQLAYWLGFKPWERIQARQAELIAALYDREEGERHRPWGRALDIGCGTGVQSVALAKRGWQTTGIDLVSRALRRARKRVREAGVEVQLVQGDVTALRTMGVGDGFSFFLDFGCFHGLTDTQRESLGREVSAVAAPGATMLMFAFPPGRRGPLPRGASADDILSAFRGWTLLAQQVVASSLPPALQHGPPQIHRLRYGITSRIPG